MVRMIPHEVHLIHAKRFFEWMSSPKRLTIICMRRCSSRHQRVITTMKYAKLVPLVHGVESNISAVPSFDDPVNKQPRKYADY